MKSFALPLSPYAGIINRKLIYQNQRNKTIENFATKIEKKNQFTSYLIRWYCIGHFFPTDITK